MSLKDLDAQQRFDLVNRLNEVGKCAFYKLREFEDKYFEFGPLYVIDFITLKIKYTGYISEDIKREVQKALDNCLSGAN